MPLPFLAILGLGAVVVGAGAHIDASDKNAEARRLIEDAREMFDDEKNTLERAQDRTKRAIGSLAEAKRDVLATTIMQFLDSWRKVKSNAQLRSYIGLNELSKFKVDLPMILRMQKMADVSSASLKGAAAGAAVGAVGTFALGGALTLAAAPIAALLAPVALFSGISASMTADENLDKAKEVRAEARAKVEKMRTSRYICDSITERCEMFDELLEQLNGMLAPCCALMTGVINAKKGGLLGRIFGKAKEFTEQELKLLSVTRALAGAVQSVIATPILDANGKLTDNSEDVADKIEDDLPALTAQVREVRSVDYSVAPVAAVARPVIGAGDKARTSASPLGIARDLLGYLIAAFASWFAFVRPEALIGAIGLVDLQALNMSVPIFGFEVPPPLPFLAFGAVGILLTSPKPASLSMRKLSVLPRASYALALLLLLNIFAEDLIAIDLFWLKAIAAIVGGAILGGIIENVIKLRYIGGLKSLIVCSLSFASIFSLALVVLRIGYVVMGFSFSVSLAAAMIAFAAFSINFIDHICPTANPKSAAG